MSAVPARPADGWPRPPDSRRPGLPRRPTGAARRAGLALAAAVLLATLAAAVRLVAVAGGTLPLPGWAGQAAEGPEAAAARRFYAALDAALAGQGDAPLAALVAPGAVVHGADGAAVPGGLDGWLATLREADGVRLAVRDLAVDGDRVAARVAVAASAGWPSLGAATDGPLWSGSEVLRVVGGRVVEYWPAPAASLLPSRAPTLTIPRQSGRIELSLVRFRLAPEAALHDVSGPLDHLIVPEVGEVTVRVDGEARHWHGDAPDAGWATTARTGQTVALGPGDALLVPAGVEQSVRNDGDAPATLLGAALLPIERLAGVSRAAMDQTGSLLALHGLTPLGSVTKVALPPGVAATHLVIAFDGCVSATTVAVRLGWLPLGPGAAVPAHSVAGQEVLVPQGGGLALADPDRRVAAGAVAVPGLAFATADGFAPRLALSGSVASRVLVLEVEPVPPVRRYGPPPAGGPCAVHGSGTGFTSVRSRG